MNHQRTLLTLLSAFVLLSFSACSDTAKTEKATSNTDTDEAMESTDEQETDSSETTVATPEGKVLRHTVFFSFKEGPTSDGAKAVTEAFKALPEKIGSIKGFQYGVNNSPEELDDGFTHCFILTFDDKAGLDEYIPHPAHKGEFADVLRPHMDKVFVIDYWGEPYESLEKELKHCVFFRFKEEAKPEDIKKVEEAFAALPSKIDAIKAFEWGTNNSGEGKDEGFTHCFMVTFDSEDGRGEYLPHPEHKAFVEILLPHLDKARVLDFWDGE